MNNFSDDTPNTPSPYAAALIRLLQGAVYADDREIWDLVIRYESPITAYFARMGVKLYLNEGDGFAYLTQPSTTEDEGESAMTLPRLTRSQKLSYTTTLVLVVLREALNQFDSTNIENNKLRISHEELITMLRPFYRLREDERSIVREMNSDINKVVELGFLKKLEIDGKLHYLVRPILKSRVSSDELSRIKTQLEQHAHDESQ
jgi:Domain of unknown function (DUF4194)